MLVNYSSPFNSSLDSVHSLCFNSTLGDSILSSLSVTRLVFMIPISIFVLHLGIQQWRQHHSFKTASHSDIFTYNLAVMELIWSLGTILSFSGLFSDLVNLITMQFFLYAIVFFAESGFHVLTCVDRYLAVVHPVKYREFRTTHHHLLMFIIRNISIFCVWLTSLLLTCISYMYFSTLSIIMLFSFLVASLIVVSFCSLSVLFALFRPGPGAEGGNRGHIDQSKQRAFFTVVAIMGALFLFFLAFLVSATLMVSQVLCSSVNYVVYSSLMWFSLPSSLVLPLLYLHKTGKLPCGHQDDS